MWKRKSNNFYESANTYQPLHLLLYYRCIRCDSIDIVYYTTHNTIILCIRVVYKCTTQCFCLSILLMYACRAKYNLCKIKSEFYNFLYRRMGICIF